MNCPEHPPHFCEFRSRVRWMWAESIRIIEKDDLRFACLTLGLVMILWGAIGLYRQNDLVWFAAGFAMEFAPWLWAANHMLFGVGLIHISLHKMPKHRSLFIGTWGTVIWAWVALGRPNSTVSSGVSLNVAIIFISLLLIYKAGKR